MHLYTDEGNIDTTANHPFYVIGKGWVAAVDLVEGDEVYNLEVEDLHSYFVGWVPTLAHNYHSNADALSNWLRDNPELLNETRIKYRDSPKWWSIDPDSTPVFYRDQDEVNAIRRKSGESGGYHPHALALGEPEGQMLTPTNETQTKKNPDHSKATGLQRRVLNEIKKILGI